MRQKPSQNWPCPSMSNPRPWLPGCCGLLRSSCAGDPSCFTRSWKSGAGQAQKDLWPVWERRKLLTLLHGWGNSLFVSQIKNHQAGPRLLAACWWTLPLALSGFSHLTWTPDTCTLEHLAFTFSVTKHWCNDSIFYHVISSEKFWNPKMPLVY